MYQMGLVESTLNPVVKKPLVRSDTTTLPSLSIDTCKFTDSSYGFLLTSVDLAKNTTLYSIPVKDMYSPSENTLVYVGKDDSVLTFSKDILSGRVYCSFSKYNSGTLVRQCVPIYEPLENDEIDRLAGLYSSKVSQRSS